MSIDLKVQNLKGQDLVYIMAGKKGKQSSEAERKRVIALRTQGYSIAEVAKIQKFLNRSIAFIKKTWAKRHWPSLKTKKRKKNQGN